MPTKHPAKPKVNGGTSSVAKVLRRKVFFDAYQTNGNNATQAAITAGASPKSAHVMGCRWLKEIKLSGKLVKAAEKVAFDSGLSVERWAKEMACIGHLDPAELYDADGNLIPIHELPEHVRRAIASVKPGNDKGGPEVKLWDKNAALLNIGKHLGVFEQDNRQRTNAIQVNVQLLG